MLGLSQQGYFACDTKFLNKVQERFFEGRIMTRNEIVLLVRIGNPKELRKLEDLGKLGVKLGICDGRKSALGELTRIMLERRGLTEALEANVAVKVAKGDDLVSALQARSLDAVLVYRSNALASPVTLKENEIVELKDELAFAEQPFAVAKESAYPELMKRLGNFLATPEAKERFEELGFQWELN